MNVRPCLALLPALAAALLAGAAPAIADCPASIVQLEIGAPFAVLGATLDTADVDTHATYDRARCEANLTSQSGGLATDYLRVVEAFDVAGLAPGTIAATTITFQLDGSIFQSCGASGCGVEMSATLRAGTDSVTAAVNIVGPTLPTSKPLVQTLSLPVTLTAGTPVNVQFTLRYQTGPGQEGASGTLAGRWSVLGLPAGASAISCFGTTPVRIRSWGALKTLYR